MKSISSIMMEGMFAEHTYELIKYITSIKAEGLNALEKEDVLASMITLCEDKRAQLLIADKGIDGLCKSWDEHIGDDIDNFIDRCNGELSNRRGKMMYVFELFMKKEEEVEK